MAVLSKLAHLPDLSLRQMVFFYELCKMGVVKFDLNNSRHKAVLLQMVDMLKENSKKDHTANGVERRQLFALIVFQLLKYAIPEERSV